MVTTTPGSTPPPLSNTVPASRPKDPWANAVEQSVMKKSAAAARNRRIMATRGYRKRRSAIMAFMWRASVAIVLASLSLASVLAQDQSARPIFRTGANYVRVDVYPTRNGTPVTDLTRDDFEVYEDKAAQTIDEFEHVVVRSAGPQDARREPNT